MPRTARTSNRRAIRGLMADYTERLVAFINGRSNPADALRARVLAALGGVGGGSTRRARTNGAGKIRRKVSAKQHAAAKLQGAYMGTIRLLPAAQKAKVKKVREKDGVAAAIKVAKQLRAAA
jgi:hypothetical protein